jgi:hypothetical protein
MFITVILVVDRMEEKKKHIMEINKTSNLNHPHKKMKSIVKHGMTHKLSDMNASNEFNEVALGT